jgi:predicted RNA-binding protein with PUA-like domain
MEKGDSVFFYHSNEGLEIVGIAEVVNESYQDPTTFEEAWVVVDLAPVKKLTFPVSLSKIKSDIRLQQIALVKQSRLSVQPITQQEWEIIIELSENP